MWFRTLPEFLNVYCEIVVTTQPHVFTHTLPRFSIVTYFHNIGVNGLLFILLKKETLYLKKGVSSISGFKTSNRCKIATINPAHIFPNWSFTLL